jgi:hypothetical protein
MNRPEHENVNFFVGTEVEHTPAFGRRTLFVVGWQPVLKLSDYWPNTIHIQTTPSILSTSSLVPITVFILPTDWSGNVGKA